MLKATRARLAHYWAVFRCGGPVALGQAVRQTRIQKRIAEAYSLIDREEALHDEQVAALRGYLNFWLGQQQAVAAAQAHFARFVARTNRPQKVQA